MAPLSEAYLIYGWPIDLDLFTEFLIQNKVGTCCGTYFESDNYNTLQKPQLMHNKKLSENKLKSGTQCLCGTELCWKNMPVNLEGIRFICTSSIYVGNYDSVFITLLPNTTTIYYVEELQEISKNTELIQRASYFACLLSKISTINNRPSLMSVVNIW